jgi:energy-coupling factor transporter ATP-binding protein EcfA2
MKIIMLLGENNCGKSTTLNWVYDCINPASEDIICTKSVLGNPIQKDFECIIRYQNKTVAFFTMGDYSNKVCEAMVKYDKLNCDILVCACNPQFVNPRNRIKNYPHHIIIEKTVSPNNHDCGNKIDVCEVLKEILKAMLE